MMPVSDSKEVQKQHSKQLSCRDLASTASSGGVKMDKAKLVGDYSEHSKSHPPGTSADERYISFSSIQNERYSLGSQPSSDHDNEDELIVYSNKSSLCMCVFDGHDGLRAVRFVKKYMNQHVFGKPAWDDVIKSNKPEKIKVALVNCIQESDVLSFKSIDPLIFERQRLQSEIPKVRIAVTYT